MLMTFVITLKVLIRDRDVLFWAIAFPLVLSTLFAMMFANLDESYELKPIPIVVIANEHYRNTESFKETIEALATAKEAKEDPLLDSAGEHQLQDRGSTSAILDPLYVPDEEAAIAALKEGSYTGFISIDAEGNPLYTMDSRRVDALGNPSQSIVKSILDYYLQDTHLILTLAKENPQLLANPSLIENLTKDSGLSLTERISVTANPPSDSLRYMYAVLAFSTIMMSTIALVAIDMSLANTSPLGARRCLGGQSKIKLLLPTLAAAWVLGFLCVIIGFLYLRFVFGVSFGGKELAVIPTLAISVLCATFLGALIGSLPVPTGIKSGSVALLSCTLSLFAGLFGPFSQTLGDTVAQELPWLSQCNPVRQVSEAFFSLYYYDGYEQLVQCLLSLLVFSLVFFFVSALILRRQRYASL